MYGSFAATEFRESEPEGRRMRTRNGYLRIAATHEQSMNGREAYSISIQSAGRLNTFGKRLKFSYMLAAVLLTGTGIAEVVTIPHPETELPFEKTVVWSPVFQATWDALKEKSGGQPVRIEPPNELMSKLDSFRFDPKSVMPENSWKIWAGPATNDFLDQVNREAMAITKEQTGPFRLEEGPSGSFAGFGLLNRQIQYDRALYRSQKTPMNFAAPTGPVAIRFFGVAGGFSAGFTETIRILSYELETKSHAVEVLCEKGKESVVFYLPPAAHNFSSASAAIRAWKANYRENHEMSGAINDPSLHRNDSLRVPFVKLETRSVFTELLNSLRYRQDHEVPSRIVRAEQITHFDLHEKGARVRVETSTAEDPFGPPLPPPPTVPRDFTYDRPFFIFLWREKAEWPYFGAWIGDASALQLFE